MRALIQSTIETLGDIHFVHADNGFEALRALPREKVDVLLSDINMPDINGLELLSFVRGNPLYSKLPVVLISTEGSEKDIEKGLLLGANEYLVKPFSPEKLLETIKRFL